MFINLVCSYIATVEFRPLTVTYAQHKKYNNILNMEYSCLFAC